MLKNIFFLLTNIYSVLLLEYACRLSVQFFLTKVKLHTLLFEHVMQSHFPRMHEFLMLDIQCQFVYVSMKCLKQLS